MVLEVVVMVMESRINRATRDGEEREWMDGGKIWAGREDWTGGRWGTDGWGDRKERRTPGMPLPLLLPAPSFLPATRLEPAWGLGLSFPLRLPRWHEVYSVPRWHSVCVLRIARSVRSTIHTILRTSSTYGSPHTPMLRSVRLSPVAGAGEQTLPRGNM